MKVIDWIYQSSKKAIFVFMAILVLVMLTQILSRTFFGYSFKWAEELARILLVWTTFIGASVGFRDGADAAFDMLERKLGGFYKTIHSIIIQLIILAFSLVVMVYGIQLMFQPIVFNQTSPTLKIPMYILYAGVPIGMALIILYSVIRLVECIRQQRSEPKTAISEPESKSI